MVLKCETLCLEELYHSCDLIARVTVQKIQEKRDVYLKLTRHNGRAGAHGTYNPKHNDRSFNLSNSEHIDPERAKGNIYWDCFHGFRSALDPQDPDDLPAFADVADPELAQAAQWAIEQGYLKARADGSFKPDKGVAKWRVIRGYRAVTEP